VDEQRRLGELLGAYLAAAEGRVPAHRLPVLGPADTAALVDVVHDEMAQGETARAAHAAEHGHTIACARGCDACCANVIVVYEPEAVRVAAWLAEPAHAGARARFEAAWPRWQADAGEETLELKRLHERGEIAAAEALYAKLQRRAVMCAFNRDGACTIHPVRPNVCRNAHALDTPERCRPGSPERPRALELPPLDAFVRRASALFRTLHGRARPAEGPSTLCASVRRLLEAPPADAPPAHLSRNAPCPCGSGKKLKICCGT
jgi:hypothetical protein